MKKFLFVLSVSMLATMPAVYGAADPIIFNGGITVQERAGAPTEGTRLVFAVTSGNFLSAIDVSVTNVSGTELVNVTTEGPWLILDLDPGSYQVVATRGNGQVQNLTIEVSGSSEQFIISFPEQE